MRKGFLRLNQLTTSTWRYIYIYLENDRDFGIIEKRKQSAEVYIPSQWYQVVREASLKKPFQVVEMHQEDFLDFKGAVAQRYALQNKDRDGNRVLLREIHWLNFGWGAELDRDGRKIMVHHPYEVWMRRSFSSESPGSKYALLKGKAAKIASSQVHRHSFTTARFPSSQPN